MVFNEKGDEGDKGQEDETGTEEENKAADEADTWGVTPLLLAVSQKTMTPLQQLYDWAITEFLYYASYIVEQNQKELRQIKRIQSRSYPSSIF